MKPPCFFVFIRYRRKFRSYTIEYSTLPAQNPVMLPLYFPHELKVFWTEALASRLTFYTYFGPILIVSWARILNASQNRRQILIKVKVFRICRLFYNGTKVCKTEPVIPLRTCLSCMAGAPQGAFVLISKISPCDAFEFLSACVRSHSYSHIALAAVRANPAA